MIRLKYILEQAKNAKQSSKPKKLNVLFVGDADTTATFSYARDILKTREVNGNISAANISIEQFPRLLQTADMKKYNVICIMYSNIKPGKTTREEEVLQQMYTDAKDSGAMLIAITPTTKEFVAYGHITHENNESIVQWVLEQNIADHVIDAYKLTRKKNFFNKDGLLLNAEGHELIARQVLRVLNEIDSDVDAAAIEREKQSEKEKSRKTKRKDIKGKVKKAVEFKRGSKSPDLIEIQQRLVKLGYEIDPVEIKQGLFGETTETAVMQFQTINDLSVTSKLTKTDINAIKSSGAKSYGTLSYMAKSLVNKPVELPKEEPDSKEPDTLSTQFISGEKYDAETSDDIITQAAAILRSEEGFSTKPHWDVNNWRIGYGSSTITDASGKVVKLSSNRSERPAIKITQQDAERDLQRRLRDEFIPHTKKSIGTGVDKLNNATIAALTSVTYNYGTLPSSVVQAARTGDIESIADAVRSLSANRKRRNREADWIQNSKSREVSKTIATGNNGKLSAGELVSIGDGFKLNADAAADFLEMKKAANADGVQFKITDAYRPYEIQDAIFDWERYNRTGEKKKKGTNVAAALPGTSNHGWGKAIDVSPAAAQQWIKKNGYKYNWSWYEGKSLNPPEHWHFTWTTDSSKLKEW